MLVKKDILAAVVGALYSSKCLGLLPFAEVGLTCKLSPKLVLASVLMCLTYTLYSVLRLMFHENTKHELHFITEIVGMTVAVTVSVFEIIGSRNLLSRSVESLEEADLALRALRRSTVYSRRSGIMFFNVALVTVTVALKCSACFLNGWRNILELAFFTVLLVQLLILVYRYTALLGIAACILRSAKKEIFTSYRCTPTSGSSRLEDLLEIHCRLCVSTVKLNDCFQFQVLAIIVSSLLICVSVGYRTLFRLVNLDDYISFGIVINTFVIGTFFSLSNYIVSACKRASQEAKEFNTVLYQLMLDDKTSVLSTNNKLRLHFSMKKEIVFTVCGLFKLDYTLVHSMVAAATTYLVILIQIGQSSEPEPRNCTLPAYNISNLKFNSSNP